MSLQTGKVFALNGNYRLFYQDIARIWHETSFTNTLTGFRIKYHGPKHWWHFRTAVPNAVSTRSHFATTDELV